MRFKSGSIILVFILLFLAAGCGSETTDPGLNPPDAPTGVTASDGIPFDRVVISWNTVPEVLGYRVFRSISTDGDYSNIASVTNTTYDDIEVTPGTVYYYKIAAYNSDGDSELSAAEAGSIPPGPNAPESVTASDSISYTEIQVSWSSISNADGYQVYRSTLPDSGYVLITNTDQTGITDTAGLLRTETYYYKIKATNQNGVSAFSSYDNGALIAPPTAPDNVSATDGTYPNRVVISWNSSTGAIGYKVYRSTSSDSGYSEISNTTATTIEDYSPISGTVYYYRVLAYDVGGDGPQSTHDSGSLMVAPGTPSGVTASDGTFNDRIEITWNAVAGASGYRIFRATSSGGTYSEIGTSSGTSYNDTGASEATYYYYKICATNAAGDGPQSSSDKGHYTVVDTGIISGIVTDSLGGSPVSGATVTVNGSAYSTTTATDGSYTLFCPSDSAYDLVVTKAGMAESKIQSIQVGTGLAETINIILPVAASSFFGTTAPTISVSGVTNGQLISTVSSVTMQISVSGVNPVTANDDHQSISVYYASESSVFPTVSSETQGLTVEGLNGLPTGATFIYIVAYDINNNRSVVKLNVTNQAEAGTAPTAGPGNFNVTMLTFGQNLGLFKASRDKKLHSLGRTPSKKGFQITLPGNIRKNISTFSAPSDATIMAQLNWSPVSGAGGYKIYRSINSTSAYKLIGTVSGTNYNDTSSDLTVGQTCYYKISAFNQNGTGPECSAKSTLILGRYNLTLTGPTTLSMISSLTPTFTWSAGAVPGADGRIDFIYVREVNGGDMKWTPSGYINSTSAAYIGDTLDYGRYYEWDIFDSFYVKTNNGDNNATSLSLPRSGTSFGTGSINGAFYFMTPVQ